MSLLEWILFCLGHLAIACLLFNQVHAFAFPATPGKRGRKATEKFILLLAVFPFPLLAYLNFIVQPIAIPSWLTLYLKFCQLIGIFFILRWAYRLLTTKLPVNAKQISTQWIDVSKSLASPLYVGFRAKLYSWIPFNQSACLKIENWELGFPKLPTDFIGLKICHLSDLHFTGLIGREYFDEVIRQANEAKPELIFITGDILDEDECLGWVEEVLAKLEAKYGVYFIRGNHDLLISDQRLYLERLRATGMTWAADGKWHEVRIGESVLQIAGNELPWYSGATLLELDSKEETSPPADSVMRLLLAHSPDQIGWAVRKNFAVVFAGHTHGGQIRLPIAGPIIAPSRYGIKFASGTFRIRDTLMHVSRGVSGDMPVRLNCPPELGFFTLVRSEAES